MEKAEKPKFTYRIDEDIYDLLNKALNKTGLKSMNKLLDKLVVDALINLPDEIKEKDKKISSLLKSLEKAEKEKNNSINQLQELKSLIAQEQEIKNKIESFLNKS